VDGRFSSSGFPVPDIFIDGERIQSPGEPPSTFAELVAFIDPALLRAERVLSKLAVDGRIGVDPPTDAEIGGAGRIEVFTVSVSEAVAQVAAGCAENAAAVWTRADALANEVLRVAWSEAAGLCAGFGDELGRLVQDVNTLAGQAGAGSAMIRAWGTLASSVERWVDGVQTQDAAAVCLRLHHELLPALRGVEDAARGLAKGDAL
jgi:hypothetical protein